MKLEGSRIIITGAASGIGFALLRQLAGMPCQIIAADLRLSDMQTALSRIVSPAAHITAFGGDIGLEETMAALFDTARRTMGGVDIFIANAGFAYYERLGGAEWPHIERIFRVNAVAPIAAVTRMAAEHANGSEYLVAINASAMARYGLAGYALYSATKAALDRFVEAYRNEAPANAHILIAYPITTRTRFFDHEGDVSTPVPKPSQSPEYVARRLLEGIEKNATRVHPSTTFRVVSGVDRLIPVMRLYRRGAKRQFDAWLTRTGN